MAVTSLMLLYILSVIIALLSGFGMEALATLDDFQPFEDKPEIGSMQDFPGGSFYMGTWDKDGEATAEYPVRVEYTKPFRMDRYPVTNGEFSQFVRRTSFHRTTAEKKQYSYVFYSHVAPDSRKVVGVELDKEAWWIPVYMARWDKPFGQVSSLRDLDNHPVVHVSLYDAAAFCAWKGKRLPTEFEWEYAIRSGNHSWTYPWGDGLRRERMNVWHGSFPSMDDGWDGFKGTSPVNRFPSQNVANMYDMLGNVWEWTETWWSDPDSGDNRVVLKGGSFVDTTQADITPTVRCSARLPRPPEFTAGNVGFRCVEPLPMPTPPPRKPVFHRYEDTWQYKEDMKKLSGTYHKLKETYEDTIKNTEL